MAISLEEALVAVLNAASPVTAIVSDRIQCGESAPEWQSLPDLFFEVDYGDYDETFSGELEERRLQMVKLSVTARALSIAGSKQALAAATDSIRAASGQTITIDGDSAIAIEDVQVEDPGSDGGSEEVQREGTTASVYYRVARYHVAYYDNAEPGEAADDDGGFENEPNGTPTSNRDRHVRDASYDNTLSGAGLSYQLRQTPSSRCVPLVFVCGFLHTSPATYSIEGRSLTFVSGWQPQSGEPVEVRYFH